MVVVNINKEFVEFAWVPGNAELLSAILQIRLLPEGSRPPVSKTPTHRRSVVSSSEGWLDKKTSVVHFILRPNQTFYAETFEVFEGVPSSLAGSINRAIQLETTPDAAPMRQGEDPNQIIKDLRRQLGEIEERNEAQRPQTSEDAIKEQATQKQNPKAQMMRTLGIQ